MDGSAAIASRTDFPCFDSLSGEHVLFDNAATTQKPAAVIEAVLDQLRGPCASPYRGVHSAAQKAEAALEQARVQVATFLGAAPENIVFCGGCTDGLNHLAWSIGESLIRPGDEVIVTDLEHHSNLLPWQQMCKRKSARLVIAKASESADIEPHSIEKLISSRTRVIALAHVSNITGGIAPIADIAAITCKIGALLVVDGAQGAAHVEFNVPDLGCDFYVCSGHKMYGPPGCGFIWVAPGREQHLLRPWRVGGGSISTINEAGPVFLNFPRSLEGGTPNLPAIVGMGTAATYLQRLGKHRIETYEQSLVRAAVAGLENIELVRLVGAPVRKSSIVSFTVAGAHPHDVASILSERGFATRAGHHCAIPATRRFCPDGSVRISLGVYNTISEVQEFLDTMRQIVEMFRDKERE
ncbi:aminotransferase class V-fold PLP-dependent enzyme [Cupriavidus lacunae]|uniref:aminotransferase class V-fold PLP-dependent enzyme n=1 Tax=Cupriavidus lacunae TaxID=2666307 RepID=UPI00137524E0|nr:cysteine desulfurase [Cupriavidus lacunae]